MKHYELAAVVGLAALTVSASGCGARPEATAHAEAPPPPIEASLEPASRLIDPRVEELVRQMSDYLARVAAFSLDAEEIYDEVPEHEPRQQLTNRRSVTLRRPDRLAGNAAGDAIDRAFWYDGRVFAVLDREHYVWASGVVPPTIDEAMDSVFTATGTVIPLADFLYTDSYTRLMGDVLRGVYLGIHDAAGVPCHHLSFEQAEIDWQLWIDAGKAPLPRKLVISYKTEDEVPQYSVTIKRWNLEPNIPEATFRFEPPEGAQRVEIPALASRVGQEQKP